MYTDIFNVEHRYAPPGGWVLRAHTVNFSAAEEWAALVERGLSFPEYRGPSTLTPVRGDCLEPLITQKHMLRTRPVAVDEPLIDGGLYAIELGASAENSEAAAYREKHGMEPGESFVICKFLRWIGMEWFAQAKDSVSRLSEYGAVVAMVVAVSGCEPVHSAQIAINGATVIALNTSAVTATGITGSTGLQNTGVVVNPTGPGVACTIIVTATISARQTVGTVGQVKLLVRYADDGLTPVSAGFESPILTASYVSYTLQWQFAHTLANANHLAQASIWLDNTGPSTNSVDWTGATLQVEYILR
jgi:hypothetical protein